MTPAALTLLARAESLPFALMQATVVRDDPRARLEACATRLGVSASLLATLLAGCPTCRAYVVWGEVRA